MKKFGKLLFGTAAIASIAAGAYYIYKKFINKDISDDFDDFEDDFEDFDLDEDAEEEGEEDTTNSSREYVTLNMTDPSNEDSGSEENKNDAAPQDEASEASLAEGE